MFVARNIASNQVVVVCADRPVPGAGVATVARGSALLKANVVEPLRASVIAEKAAHAPCS